jgi:hypothetical protein
MNNLENSSNSLRSFAAHPPQFGVDYDIGWIFFVNENTAVADGIAWFERWDRNGRERVGVTEDRRNGDLRYADTPKPRFAPVIHTGVCAGEDRCYEAHWETGVSIGTLSNYFGGPIYFRRPHGWTVTTGVHIAAAAAGKLGCKYNKGLILAQFLANTLFGHFVNALCRNRINDKVSAWLDRRNEYICSELCAYALNEQPQYRGRGVLAQPLDTISPQMLFDDPVLWEDAAQMTNDQ